MTPVPHALTQGIVRCHVCGLACEQVPGVRALPCPRCHAPLHPRLPDSLSQSWALLLTGLLLYLPANLLPVMYNSFAGRGSESTILAVLPGSGMPVITSSQQSFLPPALSCRVLSS